MGTLSKYIELVRVRSAPSVLTEAMPSLTRIVEAIKGAAAGPETFFMQHALFAGDVAVMLVWTRAAGEVRKSREGLLLAEEMQALGSVDHAVWIPALDAGNPQTRRAR